MELIGYFKFGNFYNLFFMNNVQNQNVKVLEEMLAGSNSDIVKATMRGLHNSQNGLSSLVSSWKASHQVTLSLEI